MINRDLMTRMEAIHGQLMSAYSAGSAMTSATKGVERETFVHQFLSTVFNPKYRYGSGDIIDQSNRRSGQVDVVVEYPYCPSIPVVGNDNPRLYMVESVAAAVEVKSDLAAQWREFERTAEKVKTLRREYPKGMITMGHGLDQQVPVFAVGFTGWKTEDAIREHLNEELVDGILVIDSGHFLASSKFMNASAFSERGASLWALICCIHFAASTAHVPSALPFHYGFDVHNEK